MVIKVHVPTLDLQCGQCGDLVDSLHSTSKLHRRGSEEYLGVLSVLNERQVSDVVWFSI